MVQLFIINKLIIIHSMNSLEKKIFYINYLYFLKQLNLLFKLYDLSCLALIIIMSKILN